MKFSSVTLSELLFIEKKVSSYSVNLNELHRKENLYNLYSTYQAILRFSSVKCSSFC